MFMKRMGPKNDLLGFLIFLGLFWHLSCYLIILHLLVQFDPILMQINLEIQGDTNLHDPPLWYETKIGPHDRVNLPTNLVTGWNAWRNGIIPGFYFQDREFNPSWLYVRMPLEFQIRNFFHWEESEWPKI